MKDKLIGIEESKKIQMDILSSVDKFCIDRNIVYSLSCGTLLGAVRHSGFIPWDDDIDICMLRSDYDTFTRSFPALLDNKYEIACFERTKGWHIGYAKVFDNRTICLDEKSNTVQIGISIDVFPMDEVPDNETKWLEFREQLAKKRSKISTKIFKIKYYGFQKTLNLLIRKSLLLFNSLHFCLNDYIKLAKSNDGKGYKRVFECVLGITSKNPFPKSLFDDIVEWKFEDKNFKGFKNASIYLTQTFGDYMKLPPEKDQIPKHEYIQFWK